VGLISVHKRVESTYFEVVSALFVYESARLRAEFGSDVKAQTPKQEVAAHEWAATFKPTGLTPREF
jgi:hypothetical protein